MSTLLRITKEELQRSKPCEIGWQKFRVGDLHSEDSKDKKSVNYYFDLECVEGKSVGRFSQCRFNSKWIAQLVTNGFLPAIYDTNVDAPMFSGEDLEIDPLGLKGKEVWANIGERQYEGKQYREPTAYATASMVPF